MKISVFTLGCKTNFYESQQIVAALKQLGHDASEGLEKADIFVLNTCAITAEAERKSRQAVARARKLNPDCRIVVMGCASQTTQRSLKIWTTSPSLKVRQARPMLRIYWKMQA